MRKTYRSIVAITIFTLLLPVFSPILAEERTATISIETEFRNHDQTHERDAQGGWSIEVVDAGPNAGYDISMAMEANGNLHISYYHDNNEKLMYAKWDGSSWTREVIGDMTIKNYGTSIALDSSGNPYISVSQSRLLKLFYKTGGVWKNETVDGGTGVFTGCYSSIALGSADDIHISYQNATTNVFDLMYVHKSVGNWLY